MHYPDTQILPFSDCFFYEYPVVGKIIQDKKIGSRPVFRYRKMGYAKTNGNINVPDRCICIYDFVARFVAPKYGIPEDPVTGSAYTQLAPYWTSKIGLKRFRVKQMSSRGGELTCEVVDDRVLISGKAIKYMEGRIKIET